MGRAAQARGRLNDAPVLWQPQPGPQQALLSLPDSIHEAMLGGARGGGKGQALDAPVLTPFGWREMGALEVGSAVCSPDGSVARVIGVFPLGPRQLYRVTFHDGTSCEVTDDHIWLAWRANQSNKSCGRRRSGEDSARLWTTAEMIRRLGSRRRFLVPVTAPVAITTATRHRVMDPYVLGVLIGDGSLSANAVTFTSADPAIADRVRSIIGDALLGPYEYDGATTAWRIASGSATMAAIRKLGLIGKDCFSKRIPKAYLLGSIPERWELLRGLMDTDGWADLDGDIYYGTSGEGLRDDVAALARSLGAVVTIRSKIPTFTNGNGAKQQGARSWTLRIKLRDPAAAFTLERKRERCRAPQSMHRAVVSIEPTRIAEARCIQVDHPNGLYLTDDFIVTHNTDAMLGDFLEHAMRYGEHAKGMFVRRTFKQLEEVVARSKQIYPASGALWRKVDATWVWLAGPAKGATLKMRHLWDESDAENYQGHQSTWVCLEELTNWPTPGPMDKLRATLRSAAGVPVALRATCNPGGVGHNWVKARYITPAPLGYTPIRDPRTGQWRVFIPARLEHNLALMQNDPEYEARLMASGPEALVKAWRFGIWDIVAGGFFDDVWRSERHILPMMVLPPSWPRRRSFDWGSASPSSLGFWAESDGTPLSNGRILPRGSLVRYKEWYTVAKDEGGYPKPNVGLRLTNEQLGAGIADLSGIERFAGCVADPSIFTDEGGPSIYKQMVAGARVANHRLIFAPADNSRVAGWQRMREMLQEAAKDRPERPGLWIMETCEDFLRTVPVLPANPNKPDDVDTDAEDHAGDDARYMIMRRSGGFRVAKVTGA